MAVALVGTAIGATLAAGCSGDGRATPTDAPPSAPTATTTQAGARPPARVALGAAQPCVGHGPTGRPATYHHVVWIWMENKAYDSVIGNSQAPFENQLANRCGVAADYHGVRHPSLPNYLAATGGQTFGVADDEGPDSHPIPGPSLFAQVEQAGLSWRAYEESMPAPCTTHPADPYAVKHNPPTYYTDLRSSCLNNDVPFSPAFGDDVDAGRLPAFSFVTPNLCHDMHDCDVATGDAWLRTWVTRLLDGPNYRAGDTVVVLTWDEGVGDANQMPTIVVAPGIAPATVARQRLDHYALLRMTEDLLGLPPLGNAAGAPSMRAAFGF